MKEEGTSIHDNTISVIVPLDQKIDTSPQLYFLFSIMILLFCYTIYTVGDRGAGITGFLVCIVVVTALILNFSNLVFLFEIFQSIEWSLGAFFNIFAILAVGILGVQYFRKNFANDKVKVINEKTKILDDKLKSREEYEEALKRTISPGRPSVCDLPERKVEKHEWSMVPDTILSEVLNKLDQTAIKSIRLVCKEWYNTANRSLNFLKPNQFHPTKLVHEFPYVQKLDISECLQDVNADSIGFLQLLQNLKELNMGRHHRFISTTITDNCIVQLKSFKRLLTLNLAQCVHVSDAGLEYISRHLLNLKDINISGCVAVTDSGVQYLATLKNLEAIEIPWCLKLTDKSIEALTACSKLKKLDISGCQMITEKGIRMLSSFKEMEHLNLLNTGYSKICVTDESLYDLKGLGKLKSLSIGNMQIPLPRVSDVSLKLISESFLELRELNLMWLNISDLGIEYLKKLKKLKSVSVRGCERISESIIENFAAFEDLEDLNLLNNPMMQITSAVIEKLSPLKKMKNLYLGDMEDGNILTDTDMEIIASFKNLEHLSLVFFNWHFAGAGLGPLMNMDKLKSVDFQGSNIVNDSTLSVLSYLPNIETLQLSRCGRITSAGLKCFQKMAKLQTVTLAACPRIDDSGLAFLGASKNLVNIILSQCQYITDNGLAHLGNLKKLKFLDISGCNSIFGIGFETFGNGNNMLTTLSMNGCPLLNDDGLCKIGRIKSLTKIDMCQCLNVSDMGVIALSELANLTALDLALCYRIGDNSIMALSRLPHLTTLKLSGCLGTTDSGVAQLVRLNGLLTVHLDRCHNVTDRALVYLGKCTSLTSLRLAACPYITNLGVSYLASLKRLSILNLTMCPHVTHEGAKSLNSLNSIVSLEI